MKKIFGIALLGTAVAAGWLLHKHSEEIGSAVFGADASTVGVFGAKDGPTAVYYAVKRTSAPKAVRDMLLEACRVGAGVTLTGVRRGKPRTKPAVQNSQK